MERPAMKRKANQKNKNCTNCQSLSVKTADTVMLCENIGFNFRKFS